MVAEEAGAAIANGNVAEVIRSKAGLVEKRITAAKEEEIELHESMARWMTKGGQGTQQMLLLHVQSGVS